mgnify:CR=1 FL=1
MRDYLALRPKDETARERYAELLPSALRLYTAHRPVPGPRLLVKGVPLDHAALHRAVDEAGAVMAKMKEMPVNDFFAKNGRIRDDGRMVHDMYVFQVKKPAESTGPWDYYRLIATRNSAFQKSRCSRAEPLC